MTTIRGAVFSLLFCIAYIMAETPDAVYAGESQDLFFLSPAADWYFPSDGKTKNAFGNSWGGFGVTLNLEALNEDGGWGWDNSRLYPYIGFFHADEGGSDAYLVPVGIEFRWHFGDSFFRPYIGLAGSVYGVKFEHRGGGIDTGWKGAWGGRLSVGMDITRWFSVQGAYNFVSDVKGYDMSGFSVQGKFKIYF